MKIGRLPALFRTTTFRLALLHASIFILFSASLLAYLYYETAGHLGRQAEAELNAEFQELSAAYRGGFDRLNQAVTERSGARGKFFYLLQDGTGQKIAGDFDFLPAPAPVDQVVDVKFEYDVRNLSGQTTRRQAEGRISRLSEGGVLMVAYDMGQLGEMNRRITDVVWRSAVVGFVLSLIGGVVISRSAAQRAEQLARTTEEVMAGDLTRRAPVFESGDEFDRLSVQLNAMLGKLERLVISSRSAGDSIAHDLRSPLTRLRNHLEAGLRDTNSEGPRTALARSIEDVDDVLNTFNAVLRLSRVQAGATGSFRRTNVTGITDELAELYQPACEEKSMTFTYAPEGDLFVQADRDLIAQALSNLLDNAVKYTPAGGAVSLAVKRLGASEVELSVSDTGPGIPPEDRDRAVERFVRLEQSRSEPGSGLGLSLVDAVAEAHRGRLLLDSAGGTPPNIGLAARLILPSA
ncbi:MAG: two-component sensor histidine kinase [Rhodobacterales bacterium 12-64-8]|nr:MAG: two-component sensor histidine kinase [Rhodobacterales bacterium 12-64-8]OYX48686.1 MAG: two-component sensor histidine kinase [Alphaproteobacteria bacterium 32-64-14]